MLQTKLEASTSPQSFSSYSNVFGVALVSTALLGPPAPHPELVRPLSKSDIRVQSQADSSFQTTIVSDPAYRLSQLWDESSWKEIAALSGNWDGQGAEPASRAAIDHAKTFLQSLGFLARAFEPFADPDGSVGLESHKTGGASAYLVVSSEGRLAYVLRKGERVHRGSEVDQSEMRRILALLF